MSDERGLPLPPEPPDSLPAPGVLDRREMLVRAGLLTLAGAALPSMALAACRRAVMTERTPVAAGAAGGGKALSAAEWRTMAAWVETLMPSGPGSPGAVDVNAVGYVDGVMADPDLAPTDLAMIREGIRKLDAAAGEQRRTSFADLNVEDRDRALATLKKDPYGTRTIWLVLSFTLEAMFGDPVYGGNPGGVGWAWIMYEPGVPRAKTPWKGRPS